MGVSSLPLLQRQGQDQGRSTGLTGFNPFLLNEGQSPSATPADPSRAHDRVVPLWPRTTLLLDSLATPPVSQQTLALTGTHAAGKNEHSALLTLSPRHPSVPEAQG